MALSATRRPGEASIDLGDQVAHQRLESSTTSTFTGSGTLVPPGMSSGSPGAAGAGRAFDHFTSFL
ncbi:MAG: hypothetical protein MZV70_69330 [Desulfobacterales bacterium]|nr:hypothetical protein [Desulfobacterales bacterium]